MYAGISSVVVLFMYVYCTQTGTSTQNHCNYDKQTSKQTCGGTFKPIGTVFLVYLDRIRLLGRGGGQLVSTLAFYSDNLSSNPADAYSFLL